MITIELMEVLLIILALAGLVVLVFFALVLKNILSITKEVKEIMDVKKAEIDSVIDEIPVLMNNVNDISNRASILIDDVNEIVIRSKPEIESIMSAVNTSMEDVNRVSAMATNLAARAEFTADNVGHSVNSLTDNLLDVSNFLSYNKDNVIDYIYIFRDFFDEIRRIIAGRR